MWYAEDVLAVIPLTTNVCITHLRLSASSTSCTACSYVSTVWEVTSSNVLGRNSGTGGSGLVRPKGENSMAVSGLGCGNPAVGVGEQ